MEHYILPIVFIIVFVIILLATLSRKGRNFAIKTEFGGNVVEDLGIISEYRIFAGHQKLRLLKCEDNDTQFYIIEAETTMPTNKQFYWTRIDSETLEKISGLIGK